MGEAPPAAAPKTLTVGVQREPTDLGIQFGLGTSNSAGGAGSVKLMAHDKLAIEKELDSWRPQLAVELPSVAAGTWVLHPDGTMDTTWRIHPNIRWHDGQPFTAGDLMFSFKVFMDPDLPIGRPSRAFTQSASAPDPYTFVIRWSGTFVDADQGDIGAIRPKHVLDELYTRSREEFTNSPWFTTEFVGLGPYRLAHWEQGAYLELVRFDAYYMGRPPIRRMRSNAIPSAATRWSGFNRGGYENPRVDTLYDELAGTIDTNERVAPRRELVRELMSNVVLMPLYWAVVPVLMVKGVSGPKQVGTESTRNMFEWRKD